jgi:adenylylsulfate kinase
MAHDPQVVWHAQSVTKQMRTQRNHHRGCVVWFTGLSGSGKSTVANLVEQMLFQRSVQSYLLDGDNVRHGLCAGPNLLEAEHGPEFANRFGLGFGPQDREENIRRVGAITELFASAGIVCLTAFVSPYRRDRERVRTWVEKNGQVGDFIEVYVNTSIEVCMQRDPKGLYQQAIAGKIKNFTGISDPYEAPEHPDIELAGAAHPPEQLASQVIDLLIVRKMIAVA